MTQRRILTICVLATAILSGCAGTGKPQDLTAKNLQETIHDLGYTPLALPSTAFHPGTIVHIKREDPLQARVVCENGSYIGHPPVERSDAASVKASSTLANSYSLDASFVKQISASLGTSGIKDIRVTLTNVLVEEISDNVVRRGILSQSPDCTDAIVSQDRQQLGFLQSALRADATYEISVDEKIGGDAALQQTQLSSLAVKLGGTYKRQLQGAYQIKGSNLYWGVKVNKDLVLTPRVRITRAHLLDESFVDRSRGFIVTDLRPRSSTDFHYVKEDDLVLAVAFVIQDFKVVGDSAIDVAVSINIKDAHDRVLADIPMPDLTDLHVWKQMQNVEAVGLEKVVRYFTLRGDLIPCIAVVYKFKRGEIPNGRGSVEISVTDKASNINIRKSFNIQVAREAH